MPGFTPLPPSCMFGRSLPRYSGLRYRRPTFAIYHFIEPSLYSTFIQNRTRRPTTSQALTVQSIAFHNKACQVMVLRRHNSSKCPSNPSSSENLKSMNGSSSANRDAMVNGHDHHHSHSRSIFSFRTHSHGEGHNHGVEKMVDALQGAGDRGSRITLVGLFFNIALTVAKGGAGWLLHSAALLADAGHSLSDLLGDFVTLFCWKLSRKPPSARYPYGFAKFETLGTTTVSLLLIGGSLGIGFHSYNLLLQILSETVSTMNPGTWHDILQLGTYTLPHLHAAQQGHAHALDPNAAWFAAASIITKEWLYRVTKTVADEEKSPVLLANAIHHRSDAYSSIVALIAILGSWSFPAIPLDPIGGLIVSIVILRQGLSIFTGAWRQLTDAGVSPQTHQALIKLLDPLVPPSSTPSASSRLDSPVDTQARILGIRYLRARRAGSLMFVDLTADVSRSLNMGNASELEEKITLTLQNARKEISDVRVKFHPVEDDRPSEPK